MTTAIRADVARAAEEHLDQLRAACATETMRPVVDTYLRDLRAAAGTEVSQADAIDLLTLHAITEPVFDALFAPYPFTAQTRISRALAPALRALDAVTDASGTAPLHGLYQQARDRAAVVTSHEERQPAITALYEHFFRTALPKVADRHGIVFTPIEVVDFILRGGDQALRRSHGCGLAGKRVQIIDPFAGTGVFFVRLIQSDLIADADLSRVYRWQMHGHEIVPLSWYIAVTNIEIAYAERTGRYLPFTGLRLVDTFDNPSCCAASP